MKPWLALLLAVLGIGLHHHAAAYPMYFHNRGYANSCTDAPSGPVAGHTTPVPDTSIAFEVTLGGQPVQQLCPGQTYGISVAFGGSSSSRSRAGLLTVSGGSLAESNVVSCPNAVTTTGIQRVQALKANWVVPCSASGKLELKATTGVAAVGALLQNTASLSVSTACAASSCPRPESAAGSPVAGTTSTSTTTTTTATTTSTSTTSSSKCVGSDDSRCGQSSDAGTKSGTSAQASGQQGDNSSAQQQFNASGTLSVDNYTPANSSIIGSSSSGASDDPSAQTLGLLAESAAVMPACPASSLGYQCSQKVAEGVTIHYSNGAAGQPGNSCTQGAGLDTTLGNDTAMMHFAIESTQPGYAAIGFPKTPGTMVPADAVIGSVDDASGAVQVDTYRLSSESATGINVVQPVWATGLGAIRKANSLGAGGSGKVTIVCFSRPLTAGGLLVPTADPSAVPIIWAAHSSSSRQEQHIMQGSLTLNMQSGRPSALVADDSYLPLRVRYAAQIAHGILMVAACCVFMPAGVVIAHHKWLFANKESGKLSPAWFKLHQGLQQAAIVSLLASFVVAMTLFYRKNGIGSSLHLLYTPHFAMGIAVPAAVLMQAVLAAVRPALTAKNRALWRTAHSALGYGTVGLGIANSFVGVVLAHDLKSMPWPAWLVPMCVLLGSLVLAGMVLEVAKVRLQLQGRYNASTHTMTGQAIIQVSTNPHRNHADNGSKPSATTAAASQDDTDLTSDGSQL